MTHKDQGRGTLVIDRRFPGVGRIKRATGTTDRSVFKSLSGMLDILYNIGRVDLLRAIRDGKLRLHDVRATFLLRHLNERPDLHSRPGRRGRYLLARFRGGAKASRPGGKVPGFGGSLY